MTCLVTLTCYSSIVLILAAWIIANSHVLLHCYANNHRQKNRWREMICETWEGMWVKSGEGKISAKDYQQQNEHLVSLSSAMTQHGGETMKLMWSAMVTGTLSFSRRLSFPVPFGRVGAMLGKTLTMNCILFYYFSLYFALIIFFCSWLNFWTVLQFFFLWPQLNFDGFVHLFPVLNLYWELSTIFSTLLSEWWYVVIRTFCAINLSLFISAPHCLMQSY